jgi:hypothetical protein
VLLFGNKNKNKKTSSPRSTPQLRRAGEHFYAKADRNNTNDPARLNLPPGTSTSVGAPSANRQGTIFKPGEPTLHRGDLDERKNWFRIQTHDAFIYG